MRMRRTLSRLVFATLWTLVAACGTEVEPPPPPELVISPAELRLTVGQSAQLAATVNGRPGEAQVMFQSSDSLVVGVTAAGLVVARGRGVAAVTAMLLSDRRTTASVQVVVERAPPTQAPVLSPAQVVLDVGQSVVLAFSPDGNAAALFRAADTLIAGVSSNGTVTARVPGTTRILAFARGDSTRAAAATVTVRDPVRPAVYLAPASAVLYPGQRLALVPTVVGSDPAVLFRSEDTTVAVVSGEGMVSARREGIAVVAALLRADTTIRAFTTVRVVPPESDVAVAIGALTTAAGEPLDVDSVAGALAVRVEVTPGRADTLRVALGDQVVPGCTRALVPPAQQARSFVCFIDTAEFDTATAAVRFPNGRYPITARLYDDGQEVLAAGATSALNLRNADRFLARVSIGPPAARDTAGGTWYAGDVRVSALPLLYSRGRAQAVAIALRGWYRGRPVTVLRTDTDPSDGLGVRFPADSVPEQGGVSGFNSGPAGTAPMLTTAVVSGRELSARAFANAGLLTFRLDNERPLPGSLTLALPGPFVGASYAFAAGYLTGDQTLDASAAATRPDAPYGVQGVGGVQPVFHAAPAAAIGDVTRATEEELREVVRRYPEVRRGGDLPETATGDAYVLVAAVQDALGNRTYTVLPRRFGVDATAPTLSAEAPPDSINPNEPFRFAARDSLSGAAAIQLSFVRVTNDGEVCADLNSATPECDGLQLATSGAVNPFFNLRAGYYRLRAIPLDRAGNAGSPFVSPLYLHDPVGDANAPAFGAVQLPTARDGQPVEFSAHLRDAGDLGVAAFQLQFAAPPGSAETGTVLLPISPRIVLSEFGLPIVDSATVRTSFPFLRALQFTDAGGVPNPARLWPTAALWVQATDVAGNQAIRQVPISPPASNGLSKNIRGFSAGAAAGERAVCVSDRGCGDTPRSVQLTGLVSGPSGAFTIPFERVYFLFTDRAGRLQLLGPGRREDAVDNGSTLTWRYTATLDAAALAGVLPAPGGAITVFALGVDPQGDGLLSDGYVLTVK